MKIAIIDKAPSRNNYKKYFEFEFDTLHMSSVPVTKLLKKDVDLVVDTEVYDLIILVGSEAAKEYAKITSVTDYTGQLINGKYIPIINPAMLVFKPEAKDSFESSAKKIVDYVSGKYIYATKEIDWKVLDNPEEVNQYLQEVLDSDAPVTAIDTETTSLQVRNGYVLGICMAYQTDRGRYMLSDAINETGLTLIQKIIDTKEIVFHNMKFDMKMLKYHFSLVFRNDHVHDTMVMHYILDENSLHGLKALALKYSEYGDYGAELDKYIKEYCRKHGILEENFTYDLIPVDIIGKYACTDPAVTLHLYYKFKPTIDSKFKSLYENLMIPATLFLDNMEEAGIPIDADRMKAVEGYLDSEIESAKEKIYEFKEIKEFEAKEQIVFNPNSVQQLRKVLFDYLKLTPTGKLTATGALSTDAEVLEELSEEHPLPKAILNVRQLTKVKNTYITKILSKLDRDGCIRTNFNLVFTKPGRLSSSGNFNAQQILRDDPIVKGCIVAKDGYSIVSQDLQTGEMYYAAVLSRDKNLQKVFKEKGDFHSSIAKMVFNLPCPVEDVKKHYLLYRQAAKAVSFGILYGSGPQKVADTVNKEGGDMSVSDATEIVDQYFGTFSQLKTWLDQRKAFIKTNGYTYSFFGRKRRLSNVFSTDKGIASHEVRSGINAEIQSLCSDINLLGAIDTANSIKHLDAKIFMLVHDSIVAKVKDEHVEEYCSILKENVQKNRGCSIPGTPIGVDQDVGKDYSFGKFDEYYKLESGILSRVSPWGN